MVQPAWQHCSDQRKFQLLCRKLLTYIKGAVTRNASEKKINSLLDHVGQSTDMSLLQASPCLCSL